MYNKKWRSTADRATVFFSLLCESKIKSDFIITSWFNLDLFNSFWRDLITISVSNLSLCSNIL